MDPFILSIANVIASKAADAVVAGGQNACATLVKLVRERFSRDKAATAVLETASGNPENEEAVADLAATLERLARADADFEARLKELWPTAEAELSASEGGVVNSATGSVGGHLMQARDVRIESGGLHFGDVH
jgi:flagellar motility protein MotE (MotC chaperone)